ncbi:hypothetical protein [Nonomuraea lactucae]|uniref:hypothetical protein n=1 Tax=Nonomuraea lactucae TaxID=2249762 RepID=UPI000DE299DE|nr:hypothetical protein [Nonomuraea lactucae]
MALRFVGIDPDTNGDNCPSIWVDDEDGSIVIQGWEVTDTTDLAQVAARSPIPDHEKVVRVPRRMASLLMEACHASTTDDVR